MFRFKTFSCNFRDTDLYDVYLKDCINSLTKDKIILRNKDNSPILLLPLLRGHPTEDIFEGDYIYDSETHKRIDVVCYINGFRGINIENNLKKFLQEGHIYLRRGDREVLKILSSIESTPLRFKCSEVVFRIQEIVNVEGDTLSILQSGKVKYAQINNIVCLTKVKGNNYIFEGDSSENSFISII